MPRRRSNPAPVPTDIAKALHDGLLTTMLHLVQHGRQAVCPRSGMPLFDAQGTPVMRPPTAADLNVAIRFAKSHGVNPDDERRRQFRAAIDAAVAREPSADDEQEDS